MKTFKTFVESATGSGTYSGASAQEAGERRAEKMRDRVGDVAFSPVKKGASLVKRKIEDIRKKSKEKKETRPEPKVRKEPTKPQPKPETKKEPTKPQPKPETKKEPKSEPKNKK